MIGHEFAPSFQSSRDLHSRIEILPPPPAWHSCWVTLPDAVHDPQLLLYRDALECLEWLEANPDFSNKKDYVPYEEYVDEEYQDRCYSEVASGVAWNELQAEFDDDVTIHPYILASDSTHLTNFSGDKKIKPLLITSGHIHQSARAATSQRAWMCIAFLTDGKFPNVSASSISQAKELCGILSRRLYHENLRIILKPLVLYTCIPREMVDSEGFIRHEIFRLVAYICDLPEQTLVACLAQNQCVVCLANTTHFGLPHACPPRTGASILIKIQQVSEEVGRGASAWKFAQAAKAYGLNGVDHPWWTLFPDLDICKVIPPDPLHGLHKAFKDHLVTWNINLIGQLELDSRYKRLPKFPGFRHFTNGLSKISQWSGKEHRELQRTFLATIAGASQLPRDALVVTRAELDFIYLAQYRSHTDSTLEQLADHNAIFHK